MRRVVLLFPGFQASLAATDAEENEEEEKSEKQPDDWNRRKNDQRLPVGDGGRKRRVDLKRDKMANNKRQQ